LNLRELKDPLGAVPELQARIEAAIQGLMDDEHQQEAEAALWELGSPAVPLLIQNLKLQQPLLSARIAELLGRMRDRRAQKALHALLHSRDHSLYHAALWALGAMGSERHIEALSAWHLRSRGPEQERTLEALCLSRAPQALPLLGRLLEEGTPAQRSQVLDALPRFGAPAQRMLKRLLSSQDPGRRIAGLRALGSLSHPEAKAQLLRGLRSPQSEARAASILSLARLKIYEAREEILSHQYSEDTEERAAVAQALSFLGDPRDLKPLEQLSIDVSMSVRLAAAQGLSRMGAAAKEQLKHLALMGPDGSTALQAALGLQRVERGSLKSARLLLNSRHQEVRALGGERLRAGGERGVKILIGLLLGENQQLSALAGQELRLLKHQALPELLKRADHAAQTSISNLLLLLGAYEAPQAIPFVRRQISEATKNEVRALAINTLILCGAGKEEIPGLLAALKEPELREAGAKALGEIRAISATPELIVLLKDPNPKVQQAAAWALGRVRQQQALEALMTRYRSTRHQVQRAGLRQELVVAIGRIGGDVGLKVLVDAVSDSDYKVRQAAEQALQ